MTSLNNLNDSEKLLIYIMGFLILAIFIYVYLKYAKKTTKENSIPLDMLLTVNSYYQFNFIKRYILRIYTVESDEEFNDFDWSRAFIDYIDDNEEDLKKIIEATNINKKKLELYKNSISTIPDHSEKGHGIVPKVIFNSFERKLFYKNIIKPTVSFKIKFVLKQIDTEGKEIKRKTMVFEQDEIHFADERQEN